MNVLEQITESAEQTARLGVQLGALLQGGEIVCLSGDLGAGKTAFTAGIGRGWGAAEVVNSPTFVLIHEHHRKRDQIRLYHLDCYRLTSLEDAYSIGLEDILAGDGVAIIEWPEKIEALIPAERLWIDIETTGDTSRRFLLTATGPRYELLLNQLRTKTTAGL